MSNLSNLDQGDQAAHPRYGLGRVIMDQGQTVVVQFDGGIQSVLREELERVASISDAIASPTWHPPLEVIARAQAEAIQSLNDTWGVFSKSKIDLLPHQLWVCREVNKNWPARWLVADDVGLGKTIEAGLILWPLLARGTVRRLLILCPASLTSQWQTRLLEMFDIRTTIYSPAADTQRSGFWQTHNQVIASYHTLRTDHRGRHDRLLASDPWDMVIVDEAHHLNHDHRSGPTLSYRLVQKLLDANRINSMVFFTGTPHRGKRFGFWALMKLLRADLFDPQLPDSSQLPRLRHAMIRNNKQNVTDLKGTRLFHPTKVTSSTYSYSPEEQEFYDLLTEFILTGKAYASKLSVGDQRTVMLVLIAMQKIASSSVAAIRRALRNRLKRVDEARGRRDRLERVQQTLNETKDRIREYEEAESENDFDAQAGFEEQIAEEYLKISLMEDEEPMLRQLLVAAEQITEETKINRIIESIETVFPGESVLLFTEFKATQSLMMSKLMQRFGEGSVTFINGDERADGVVDSSGAEKSMHERRETAADRFNSGAVRFLISTEAGGEGIDLQENCRNLIHIDLPWNPMRLHQRVGRLNRYGQRHQVRVLQMHNPDTVESRIWELLNLKIIEIQRALSQVMDDPEDVMELVLGMTSPSVFREVFADGGFIDEERLGTWFNEKTATFGDRDAVDAVREIVGNASSFNFQQVSSQLPTLDLPHLEPFVRNMLALNHRRVSTDVQGISFRTPDAWAKEIGVRPSYEGLIFDRSDRARDTTQRVLGVGHRVVDLAMRQAKSFESSVAVIPDSALKAPVIIFKITDRVTTDSGIVSSSTIGVEILEEKQTQPRILRDEDILSRLNDVSMRQGSRGWQPAPQPADSDVIAAVLATASQYVDASMTRLDLPFKVPEAAPFAVFWPGHSSEWSSALGDKIES